MKKHEEEPEGFRVTDRRHFRETGELRSEEPAAPEREPEPPAAAPAGAPRAAPAEPPPGTAPRIDFPSYLMSYYTQGLVLLGEFPNPATNAIEQDLEAVRHIVDLLEMLRDKTRGNLSDEEHKLLDDVLYELRMKFMSKTRRIKL
jgi:hypothetical protein